MKRKNMSHSMTSLPCPTCAKPIDLSAIEWCHCVSKALSVICPSCRTCFCKAGQFPTHGEWNRALRKLLEHQTEEKFRRAVGASSASSPEGMTVLIVDD